ncbi:MULTISPECIES: hypothetical protein [Lactobacillus]|uniref:Holin n=1 Tax=Lactobacillus xujianguonis TaxID=2495899 RepID=A0A437SST0_9LACO|nr:MULTISPECIES: hypothetical protein [Lactobacillus]RVU69983.1 hypothetical protein EJK17_10050 [Lactobacillus xujianguonis]RVU72355.1 hypothetical protein EJK20_10345 [Lactobacillus xujianguonis]
MNDFWATFLVKVLGLVLGFVATAVLGYLSKHHVKIKLMGQDIDASQAIQSAIKMAVEWGIHSAETNQDWQGKDKEKYVENLAVHFLETLPMPVKDADKYRPEIRACIEATLAGAKLAKSQEEASDPAPTPVKVDGIEAVEDADDADTTKKGDK